MSQELVPYGVDDGFDEWYQKNYPTSTSEILIATSRAYKAGYKTASEEFAVANDQIVSDLRAQNEITKTWKESYDELERQSRGQIAKLEAQLEISRRAYLKLSEQLDKVMRGEK